MPTTSGTGIGRRPSETTTFTGAPFGTWVPAGGSVPITWPEGIVSE